MLAILKQAGTGRDYTIGCGITYIKLNSNNYEDARKELKEIIIGDEIEGGGYHDEERLEEAIIINDYEYAPVEDWYAEHEAELKAEAINRQRELELAELARLQAKYAYHGI